MKLFYAFLNHELVFVIWILSTCVLDKGMEIGFYTMVVNLNEKILSHGWLYIYDQGIKCNKHMLIMKISGIISTCSL